ncbi:MAG: metallophosphoesterase family protein [Candidatus Aenigmatarchaeota archaeon]
MNRDEIVKKFLDKKKLLTQAALEAIHGKNLDDFLGKEYVSLVLEERDFFVHDVKILKNLTEKLNEITTDDFVKFYKSKYERMREIILSRMKKDFVSLNKLDNFRNEVFVLGIAREIKENGDKKIVEFEDLTATKPIIFDDISDLELDDVVAIKAISAGNVLYGKGIFYPDIPLREPVKGMDKACFISDMHLEEAPLSGAEDFFKWFSNQAIKYLFVAGDVGDREKFEKLVNEYCIGKSVFSTPGCGAEYPGLPEKFESKHITSLSNPAMVEINGIKILLVHSLNLNMLKKRYLGKSKIILPEDYLVLDYVPDIVHYGHNHEAQVTNYKSVTLVNSGSLLTDFKPVVIDFATREVEQIKIA